MLETLVTLTDMIFQELIQTGSQSQSAIVFGHPLISACTQLLQVFLEVRNGVFETCLFFLVIITGLG